MMRIPLVIPGIRNSSAVPVAAIRASKSLPDILHTGAIEHSLVVARREGWRHMMRIVSVVMLAVGRLRAASSQDDGQVRC
jgi:hypothetical protein